MQTIIEEMRRDLQDEHDIDVLLIQNSPWKPLHRWERNISHQSMLGRVLPSECGLPLPGCQY